MEKFCLKWPHFETNLTVAFQELREESDLFDVTLACDEKQIEAHKVVLSACSGFFRNAFRRNKHAHPLVFLKGVKYSNIVSLLDFMYRGEVSVVQEDLQSFLAVAEELKVKGLTNNFSAGAVFPGLANHLSNISPTRSSLPEKRTEKPDVPTLPPLKRARSSNDGNIFSSKQTLRIDEDNPEDLTRTKTPIKHDPELTSPPDTDGGTSNIIVPQHSWDSNLLKDDIIETDPEDKKVAGRHLIFSIFNWLLNNVKSLYFCLRFKIKVSGFNCFLEL